MPQNLYLLVEISLLIIQRRHCGITLQLRFAKLRHRGTLLGKATCYDAPFTNGLSHTEHVLWHKVYHGKFVLKAFYGSRFHSRAAVVKREKSH